MLEVVEKVTSRIGKKRIRLWRMVTAVEWTCQVAEKDTDWEQLGWRARGRPRGLWMVRRWRAGVSTDTLT